MIWSHAHCPGCQAALAAPQAKATRAKPETFQLQLVAAAWQPSAALRPATLGCPAQTPRAKPGRPKQLAAQVQVQQA
jgi:hypothetical protein